MDTKKTDPFDEIAKKRTAVKRQEYNHARSPYSIDSAFRWVVWQFDATHVRSKNQQTKEGDCVVPDWNAGDLRWQTTGLLIHIKPGKEEEVYGSKWG